MRINSRPLWGDILNEIYRKITKMKTRLKISLTLLFTLLGSCAGSPIRKIAAEPKPLDLNVQMNQFEHPEALGAWTEQTSYLTTTIKIQTLPKANLECESKSLKPTHKSQATKLYHDYRYARYDLRKLKGEDFVCTIPARFKNDRGIKYCMKAANAYYAVLSDTFEDECGHFYRGVWSVYFYTHTDNIGTLLSKGRTVYPRAGSELENDFTEGDTYPVDESAFLFLTPLLERDKKDIEAQRQRDRK